MDRRIVSLLLAMFASTLGIGIVVPLMPIFAEDLGATGIWIGIIFSGFAIPRLIFTPIIGRYSDRKGRKIILASGLLGYTVLPLAYLVAHDPAQLALVRVVHGFTSAMVLPIAMAYASDLAPKGSEGKYLAPFNLSFFLGFGSGPFIGGILASVSGFATVFYSMCLLSSFALFLIVVFLPNIKSSQPKPKTVKDPSRSISRLLAALMLYRSASFTSRGVIFAFFAIYAVEKGLNLWEIGLTITSGVLVTAALQMPFGRLADKYDRSHLTALGGYTAALPLFLIPYAGDFPSLLLVNLLIGLGGALGFPSSTALAAREGKTHGQGYVMGLLESSNSIGIIAGPIIGGVLLDLFGVTSAFQASGVIGIVGSGLFQVLIQRSSANSRETDIREAK